jgi:hypothetical protein
MATEASPNPRAHPRARTISIGVLAAVAAIAVLLLLSPVLSATVAQPQPSVRAETPAVAVPQTTLAGLESQLNSSFMSWYSLDKKGGNLPALSASDIQSVFTTYLQASSTGRTLLQEITTLEQTGFQAQNAATAEALLGEIDSGRLTPGSSSLAQIKTPAGTVGVLSFSTADSQQLLISPASTPIGGNAEYYLVSVNYYKVNLYLFTVTYGEDDFVNGLFDGSYAQTYFNQVTQATGWQGIIDGAIIGVLGFGLGLALPTVGVSAVAAAIIAAALLVLGVVIAVLAQDVVTTLTNIYESTYANEPVGSKYMWMYFSNDYYYPWITLVGELASSMGFYGYNSGGGSVTVIGNYPFLTATISPSVSASVQSVGGKVGWNTWVLYATSSTPPVTEVNSSSGPVYVKVGATIELTAAGGTPSGHLVIYICPTASVTSSCSASPGTDTFNSAGNFGPWAFVEGVVATQYFAVKDVSTGLLSNWVQVNIVNSPVTEINSSFGPVDVTVGATVELTATGGTPSGHLVIYICPTASVTSSCSATPGTDAFNSAGNFGPWAFGEGVAATQYFAVKDVTSGQLSNWVQVNIAA